MNQKCLNVAYMGEDGKNNFLAELLSLYNSNNLTTKIGEGIEKVTEEFNYKLTERRDTLANEMPIVWNFKLKTTNVNIYSIEEGIDGAFNNSLIQCDIGFFYVDGEQPMSAEFKNQILLANILGIKSALIYVKTENKASLNKIISVFVSKNFKKNRLFIIHKNTKPDINEAFNNYFRMESRKTKKADFNSDKCIPVTNTFQLKNKYFGINATIVRGNVETQRFLKNSRTGATYKVEELQVAHCDTKKADVGSYIGMKIKNASEIAVGDILVEPNSKINNYTLITAQVLLLSEKIDRDSVVSINTIGRDASVKLVNINKTINNLNKTLVRRPDELKARETGIIVFQSREALPLKLYSNDYTLGSFLVKNENLDVIGVGIVKTLN